MLILSPDQNPLYRPSPTSPAGPTFYVDLTTPDAAVKEAMEGNNIQVWVKMAICPFYDPIFLLSLTSFLTSKWSAKLTGLSHIPRGDWTLTTFLFNLIHQSWVGWHHDDDLGNIINYDFHIFYTYYYLGWVVWPPGTLAASSSPPSASRCSCTPPMRGRRLTSCSGSRSALLSSYSFFDQ